jgi:hypothetical protein
VCLALAYATGSALGLHWFLVPLFLAEFVMLCVAFPMALKASGDSFGLFLGSVSRYLMQTLRMATIR